MKEHLSLFIMVDACGWEIVKDHPFLKEVAPHRRKLESVFGYSSTCVPSILSGRWPDEHRNWCYFVYDPKQSPFRALRLLRWLPTALTGRRIIRRYLTKFVKVRLNFRGYFDLYNIPFKYIHLFDFTEKKSPLKPKGMNRGPNIFDLLEENKVPYYVTDPSLPEEEHLRLLLEEIKSERIDFAFQYWAGLDGLLHMVGNDSPEIPKKLDHYDRWIKELMETARQHYRHVDLHVFSDHGMANCDRLLDLRSRIDADHQFGELIWLAQEGLLIVPSHMGERPIRAMHGYHPTDPQSYATLFSNSPDVPDDITHIPHIHRLMEKAVKFHAENP